MEPPQKSLDRAKYQPHKLLVIVVKRLQITGHLTELGLGLIQHKITIEFLAQNIHLDYQSLPRELCMYVIAM